MTTRSRTISKLVNRTNGGLMSEIRSQVAILIATLLTRRSTSRLNRRRRLISYHKLPLCPALKRFHGQPHLTQIPIRDIMYTSMMNKTDGMGVELRLFRVIFV